MSSEECATGSCETSCPESASTKCPCGTPGCSGDPLDCAVGMWSCAFFQAMKEVQVEYLKSRIQKAFGAKMEKAADAVLDAMTVQWQSMVAQGKAKADFKDFLRRLWQEGQK